MKSEDFRELISRAIDVEMEAYNFYCTAADRATDDALKNLFAELAAEELNHQAFLQEIMMRGSRALQAEDSRDYRFSNALELSPLSIDHKPVDGIALAIRKELDAMQMYTQLSLIAWDPQEKRAFLELARMEKSHKTRLEEIYTNMAFPDNW
jgi:rubrerythrin